MLTCVWSRACFTWGTMHALQCGTRCDYNVSDRHQCFCQHERHCLRALSSWIQTRKGSGCHVPRHLAHCMSHLCHASKNILMAGARMAIRCSQVHRSLDVTAVHLLLPHLLTATAPRTNFQARTAKPRLSIRRHLDVLSTIIMQRFGP